MDVTMGLAIWGALTGTLSVGVQSATHLRDRVKIAVGGRFDQTEERHMLTIRASNRGRQPTTLIEAAWLVKVEARVEVFPTDLIEGPFSIQGPDREPVLLAPGEIHDFTIRLAGWPDPLVHADTPLRPYVIDSHGRHHYGEPAPFLRMMLVGGWQPQGAVDTRLVETPAEPILAEPVAPRWKLWRADHERKRVTGTEKFDRITYRVNRKLD